MESVPSERKVQNDRGSSPFSGYSLSSASNLVATNPSLTPHPPQPLTHPCPLLMTSFPGVQLGAHGNALPGEGLSSRSLSPLGANLWRPLPHRPDAPGAPTAKRPHLAGHVHAARPPVPPSQASSSLCCHPDAARGPVRLPSVHPALPLPVFCLRTSVFSSRKFPLATIALLFPSDLLVEEHQSPPTGPSCLLTDLSFQKNETQTPSQAETTTVSTSRVRTHPMHSLPPLVLFLSALPQTPSVFSLCLGLF